MAKRDDGGHRLFMNECPSADITNQTSLGMIHQDGLPWSPVVKQELEDAMTLGALERNIVFRREAIRGNGSLVHRSANMWVEHRELELNIIRRERLP